MPHTRSVAELATVLRAGGLSSVELTEHCLARFGRFAQLNATITIDPDRALDQARAADHRLSSGDAVEITGIPLIHKDIFCTKGLRTTCGSRMLAEFVSPYDATVVEKLQAAGSVTLGKTNMDEFAMGSSNENSHFGPVRNPWDPERVPGGSSGGSAASVAARLAPFATGTDTGGSIRQPAALCGITGLKPSYGRVSRYGKVAFASSLDQGGPLTVSAEDAALILGTIAGFDPRDSTSVDTPVPDYCAGLDRSLDGLRIGLPKEFFGAGVDADVAAAVHDALGEYERLGATLIDVELPNSNLGIPCYYVIAPAEASSNLARFDGVRYGHRARSYTDLLDMYQKTRSQGFGEEVKRRIMIGTYALSSGYYDAYYLKAQKLRRLIHDDFERAFERCDILMGPTAPSTAFAIGGKVNDPIAMYLNDIFTNSANLAGLPAMSVPAGFDAAMRPIGLHLIGRYLDETLLLNVAHRYQQATDWHRRIPPGFE